MHTTADRDRAHPVGVGLGDAHLHRFSAYDQAGTAVAVKHGGDGRLAKDRHVGRRVDAANAQGVDIVIQVVQAMGLNTAQISKDDHAGGGPGIVWW